MKQAFGFTLIELMISLTLGVAISWIMLDVTLSAARNSSDINAAGNIVENGRYLGHLLKREIKHAGFFGRVVSANIPGTAVQNMCTASPVRGDLLLPVLGLSNSSAGSTLCSGDVLLADSDVLLIRRAGTSTISVDGLELNQHYVQSNFEDIELKQGDYEFSVREMDGASLAPIREYYQDLYYVDENHQFKRRRLINGANIVEPLANRVDDFQLEYGIDVNGDNVADTFDVFPDSTSGWQNVKSVRFFLVISGDEAHQLDTKTYNYGDKSGVRFSDKRKRRLFSFSVAVGNQY
jgi:type IV pilus assembly protein PilW